MDDRNARYFLALLGDFPSDVADAIKAQLRDRIAELGLELGKDVTLFEGSPRGFNPRADRCCAALCAAIDTSDEAVIERLIHKRVPMIPVGSCQDNFSTEFPGKLGLLNGLLLSESPSILALSLLEAAALIPRQRRVFLSYRRKESTDAALQVYAALCARQYDVFLDTHGILPGEHFQEVLWQRLCDSDVLIYLDTPEYFESRWTEAEFHRASLRDLAILRVGWPSVTATNTAVITGEVQLSETNFIDNRHLTQDVLASILDKVELLRTKSVALRYSKLIGTLAKSLEGGDGKIVGYSSRRGLMVAMNGKSIAVYPELGVPTSQTLYEATLEDHVPPVAVIYNDIGIQDRKWRAQMDWLSEKLDRHVRLVKANEAGFQFIDWL
ncbi:toll/interleukin-1 receptor domain-containing protein [Pseudomonas fluorescens]|uniref:TIR domain-containing protein n=1 Tax=Pseudomonas fluorescens TaxID=294 RepID=A0A0F4V8T4_PSEFL|nr:toll/interleukin-1 receptor domain-containing protein [Pseudomonas fluorescens]KJZ64362.1 hypothetical protein VD17_17925 [Pseudomonas fluorescens]